jgi:DNA-binding NarL/FixJ family response regulator
MVFFEKIKQINIITNNSNNIRLIIADDNKVFIEGIQLLISTMNHVDIIEVFQNGKELIQSNSLSNTDVILIDSEMPCLSEMETAKIISKNYPFIPLIAFTMHKDKIYIDELIKSGFKAIIYKPEISQILPDLLKKIVENKDKKH